VQKAAAGWSAARRAGWVAVGQAAARWAEAGTAAGEKAAGWPAGWAEGWPGGVGHPDKMMINCGPPLLARRTSRHLHLDPAVSAPPRGPPV
jgi:hypothetical protein